MSSRLNISGARKRPSGGPTTCEDAKRNRVHAQRKFAQGVPSNRPLQYTSPPSLNSSTMTPAKPAPFAMADTLRTEEFILCLTLGNTSLMPSEGEFFKYKQQQREEEAKLREQMRLEEEAEAGRGKEDQVVATSKASTKKGAKANEVSPKKNPEVSKTRRNLAKVRELRRKYQQQQQRRQLRKSPAVLPGKDVGKGKPITRKSPHPKPKASGRSLRSSGLPTQLPDINLKPKKEEPSTVQTKRPAIANKKLQETSTVNNAPVVNAKEKAKKANEDEDDQKTKTNKVKIALTKEEGRVKTRQLRSDAKDAKSDVSDFSSDDNQPLSKNFRSIKGMVRSNQLPSKIRQLKKSETSIKRAAKEIINGPSTRSKLKLSAIQTAVTRKTSITVNNLLLKKKQASLKVLSKLGVKRSNIKANQGEKNVRKVEDAATKGQQRKGKTTSSDVEQEKEIDMITINDQKKKEKAMKREPDEPEKEINKSKNQNKKKSENAKEEGKESRKSKNQQTVGEKQKTETKEMKSQPKRKKLESDDEQEKKNKEGKSQQKKKVKKPKEESDVEKSPKKNETPVASATTGRPVRKCSTIDKIWIDIDGFTSDEDDFVDVGSMTKSRKKNEEKNATSGKRNDPKKEKKKVAPPEDDEEMDTSAIRNRPKRTCSASISKPWIEFDSGSSSIFASSDDDDVLERIRQSELKIEKQQKKKKETAKKKTAEDKKKDIDDSKKKEDLEFSDSDEEPLKKHKKKKKMQEIEPATVPPLPTVVTVSPPVAPPLLPPPIPVTPILPPPINTHGLDLLSEVIASTANGRVEQWLQQSVHPNIAVSSPSLSATPDPTPDSVVQFVKSPVKPQQPKKRILSIQELVKLQQERQKEKCNQSEGKEEEHSENCRCNGCVLKKAWLKVKPSSSSGSSMAAPAPPFESLTRAFAANSSSNGSLNSTALKTRIASPTAAPLHTNIPSLIKYPTVAAASSTKLPPASPSKSSTLMTVPKAMSPAKTSVVAPMTRVVHHHHQQQQQKQQQHQKQPQQQKKVSFFDRMRNRSGSSQSKSLVEPPFSVNNESSVYKFEPEKSSAEEHLEQMMRKHKMSSPTSVATSTTSAASIAVQVNLDTPAKPSSNTSSSSSSISMTSQPKTTKKDSEEKTDTGNKSSEISTQTECSANNNSNNNNSPNNSSNKSSNLNNNSNNSSSLNNNSNNSNNSSSLNTSSINNSSINNRSLNNNNNNGNNNSPNNNNNSLSNSSLNNNNLNNSSVNNNSVNNTSVNNTSVNNSNVKNSSLNTSGLSSTIISTSIISNSSLSSSNHRIQNIDDNGDASSSSTMFYIPLQHSADSGSAIQGVALKLGTEGPIGPNQRVIMQAKLVTKAVVLPQQKNALPVGTVQPTTRSHKPSTPPPQEVVRELTSKNDEYSDNDKVVVDAPTYHLTESEFQDPFEFFERIRPQAEKYGICRIVPPPSFKPDCKVSDEMRFTAYNQYVQRMLKRWGPSTRELMAIKKYLATQSITLKQVPWIGGMEVDLPRLYQTVQACGGLMKVMERKKWHNVADMMRIPKTAQDRATKLDDIYCKFLLPYDTLSEEERTKLLESVDEDWTVRENRMNEDNAATASSAEDSAEKSDNAEENDEDEDEEEEEEEENYLDECDECIVKGRNMALSQFFRIARNTMSSWFGGGNEPDAEEVEQQFWKLVNERNNHVCVHAGAIDCGGGGGSGGSVGSGSGSSGGGFGFPTATKNAFAKHPWNLKALSNSPGSVLRSLGPVMGVTIPTLHVGMVFTTCCWYRDPHALPWIEYLHTGAAKVWYGIADAHSRPFRNALSTLLPRHIETSSSDESNIIWLPSDTAMVPPQLLREAGVPPLSRIVQRPGEFVFVMPRAFTSSVCTGYLISEAVYFAPLDWLASAEHLFNHEIRNSREPTAFSLEHLLLSIAADPKASYQALTQVLPMLRRMVERERRARNALESRGVCSERFAHASTALAFAAAGSGAYSGAGGSAHLSASTSSGAISAPRECDDCRATLHLSMVANAAEETVYCLQHGLNQLLSRPEQIEKSKLLFYYALDELDKAVEKLEDRINNKGGKGTKHGTKK